MSHPLPASLGRRARMVQYWLTPTPPTFRLRIAGDHRVRGERRGLPEGSDSSSAISSPSSRAADTIATATSSALDDKSSQPPGAKTRAASRSTAIRPRKEWLSAESGSCELPLPPVARPLVPAYALCACIGSIVGGGAARYGEGQQSTTAATGPWYCCPTSRSTASASRRTNAARPLNPQRAATPRANPTPCGLRSQPR
eukprot:scaffold3267_cov112-Isochrysis_galbana.AAC.3